MGRPRIHFEAVKAYLAEHGETRARELADAVGITLASLKSAVRKAEQDEEILKRLQGRVAYYRLPGQEPGEAEAEEPQADDKLPEFNAGLWADGDLVLVGVELNADGHSVTLGPDRVRLLCRLLHGQGPEA